MTPKDSIRAVARDRRAAQDRSAASTLDRNERTVDFPEAVLSDLRSLMTGFTLRTYPETADFYDALSQWTDLPTSNLLATDGADGGIHRVFATFVRPGDVVVHQSPTYGMYQVYCDIYRATSRPLEYSDQLELPFERLLAAVTPDVRVCALVNPNQPIESCFDSNQLDALADRCRSTGTLLVVDEAYYSFCDVTAASLAARRDDVIVVRTLSKAFGLGGLRIGYLIASAQTIETLRVLKPIYEIGHLNARIGAYVLRHPELMEQYVADVRAGRSMLHAYCQAAGLDLRGRHSNAVLMALPDNASATAVAEALASQGWLVRAETTRPIANHLRITLGPARQMQAFCTALSRVLQMESTS